LGFSLPTATAYILLRSFTGGRVDNLFPRSSLEPELDSRLLYTGHRRVSKQVNFRLILSQGTKLSFDVTYIFRCVVEGSLALASLVPT